MGGKVCKESPRNFRMFLGLFRRPKGEVNKYVVTPTFPHFPLRYPRGGAEG